MHSKTNFSNAHKHTNQSVNFLISLQNKRRSQNSLRCVYILENKIVKTLIYSVSKVHKLFDYFLEDNPVFFDTMFKRIS
jgi:hypothetical protein